MYQIVKCYKQGRAVMFYDLRDMDGTVKEKVHKDEVVKLIEDNQVSNTKVQWWEGKPIVRMGDKNVPIIRLSEAGENLGTVAPVTRGGNTVKADTTLIDVSSKATVVGKLSKKRIKESISYGGYDNRYRIERQELRNTITYKEFDTLKDLFLAMAKEYNIKHTELYLTEFAKKVDISKKITAMNMSYVLGVQNNINIYLMNMASKEMNETFVKYNVI